MSSRKPIIQVKNLVAGYDDTVILDRISFDIYAGERFVILGGSGCGKSTLLKHILGLNPVLGGSIIIDGIDITRTDDKTFQKVLRQIGVLFQSGALLGSFTVAENIALPLQEYTDLDSGQIETIIKLKLAMVQLSGFENHLPAELSGGMKKRAALARALALNPKILFFDEPSAGLDPITSAELDNLILHLSKKLNTTMVIVTHELESIFAVAERVIMLDRASKGIIAEGPPLALKDHHPNPYVKQFFNRQTMQAEESIVEENVT